MELDFEHARCARTRGLCAGGKRKPEFCCASTVFLSTSSAGHSEQRECFDLTYSLEEQLQKRCNYSWTGHETCSLLNPHLVFLFVRLFQDKNSSYPQNVNGTQQITETTSQGFLQAVTSVQPTNQPTNQQHTCPLITEKHFRVYLQFWVCWFVWVVTRSGLVLCTALSAADGISCPGRTWARWAAGSGPAPPPTCSAPAPSVLRDAPTKFQFPF